MCILNDITDYKYINNDCFSIMKKLPDKSINLILCDPPYNLSKYSTGNMKFDWRAEINNDVAKWDKKPLEPAMLLPHFKRILSTKGNIFIFTSYNLLGKYHEIFDPEFDVFNLLYGIKLILSLMFARVVF